MELKEALDKRILVLDGGLGTMIQGYSFKENDFRGREFIHHSNPINGFNDILNITKPNAIKSIHRAYLEAGANIITTNTFNSNRISMRDYELDDIKGLVRRLNYEGAQLAQKAIKEFIDSQEKTSEEFFFVGGSIGPTNRSASMSPDITDPLKRNISYSELYTAYKEQIAGLIEGGVDLLIFETFFDTLNLKAGLDAANKVFIEKRISLPIMVSATVSDKAGRILSGQTLDAFITSISHYDNIEVIGINCGFGPDRMVNYIREINKINSHYTSCHPNAGLPDESECYDISPKEFAEYIKPLLEKNRVNIIGGCCGTTPEYIKELSLIVKNYKPFQPKRDKDILRLSGLDMLTIKNQFLTIGERCNVAGSAKFLRLIKDNLLEEASEIAKAQIRKGAQIIDINMDDAMLNSEQEMVKFIRYILAEPDVAKVPFMIDSSKWNVIEKALENIQGKGIVNSLSLKEGEKIFIEKATRIKELGFVLVVMAFDESGQADTFERKVEICQRSYDILIEKCGYYPEDIIFDVNVMTIATGMKEHAKYAVDFIEAVKWIKNNLPGVRTSGGVSNLSFAFRGKNKIREYMHIIFLYHARKAGLDMAIINPSQTTKYEDIPDNIREIIEDIIFDRDETAVDRLINIANEEVIPHKVIGKEIVKNDIPYKSIKELLIDDLVKGELIGIEKNILSAIEEIKDPVKIIEGPLLQGMKKVGDLFGEGKMFLPQVVKTARSMKKAVEILTPYIEKANKELSDKKAGKILIATVKGDVHDIGKNIVSTVLSCNNYEVIDLGIMVPAEKIVETVIKEKPDFICLSGLITPSLGEMTETVKLLSQAGIKIPVMVGGAATSLLHTAIKIDPFYKGMVLHMSDASQNPITASALMNIKTREDYLNDVKLKYEELRKSYGKKTELIPYYKVLDIVDQEKRNNFRGTTPCIDLGKQTIIDIPLAEIISLINWKMFFLAWKLQGKYLTDFPSKGGESELQEWLNTKKEDPEKAKEALQLFKAASNVLEEISEKYDGKGIIAFEEAVGDDKNIIIRDKVFPMLRQQRVGSELLSCCDYIGNKDSNYIGLFAVTAGKFLYSLSQDYEKQGDSYLSLVTQTLSDRLAEASAEWLQNYVNDKIFKVNIRPAWGYPMLPDQTLILNVQDFISFDRIGVSLTENGAMYPPASISGLYISKPDAKYFMVGEIGEDQIMDYAARRNLNLEKIKGLLRQI